MSDKTKMCIALMIHNMVAILCFTFIAFSFNKWWIALLAIFFIKASIKYNESDNDTIRRIKKKMKEIEENDRKANTFIAQLANACQMEILKEMLEERK